MPMQSKFIGITAKIVMGTMLLVTINVAARGGEVRDHRSGSSGGGVQVTNTSHNGGTPGSTTRDHRTKPVVRDHRKPILCFGGLTSGTHCY
jgi:hypothetical protein